MSNNIQRRQAVEAALHSFANAPLPKASAKLLNSLGYASEKTTDLGGSVESLLGNIEKFKPELGIIRRDKVKADRWKSCAFLFQLTNDEITSLAVGQASLGVDNKVARSQIESFVFVAIELQGESWSRTDLAAIVRELNRRFPMPAIVIFRHGELLSLAVIDRRANLKDSAKDVIDSRITVIKDVRIANPHRAHLDILSGLALENLGDKRRPANFRELYDAWIEALSTQALNKRFYQELANWYFWALTQAKFPKDATKDADGLDSPSLIRLITRIIFCWFLKEKGLLPSALFDPRKIATLLGDYNPTESNFYKAILQNLFFATLNQEMDKRVFRKEGQNFMAHNLYRYRSLMKNPDEVLKLLAGIPFMNGGLFECLDKTLGTKEKPAYVRIDGFSDRGDNPLKIPNELFFGDERIVDLSDAYGDNKFKSAKVAGLIHILDRYKFTVAENTPIEEEVALDPELLGKVFENLLAAYNPETGATARKQTGSFYTPREIVNYMVDESLIASLKNKLKTICPDAANTEERLRHLFAYTDQPHKFTTAEVESLIEAIDHLKILDPACGSGAFPMGVLHKLVFVLGKLDPGNRFWKARQLAKASEIEDATVRERVMSDIEQTFGSNELDYGRKLYLIENCIYGVDIQPIAVQISKLRFFISLVVEQKFNPQADNLGIRPLPNLETKFVAANTLIGVNRPGQQLLRNPDIDAKEAELHLVRERHFLARTPTTKARCREQDAALRAEIAELLKSDGWNTATACALADWNPYDQNASAGFFDLEWMFGITDGFDVIIGNPPYVNTRSQDETTKNYIRANYRHSKGADIYVAFIEHASSLLCEGAPLTFIVPNKFFGADYGKAIRKYLQTGNIEISSIWDLKDEKVFESAQISTVVIVFRKQRTGADPILIQGNQAIAFPDLFDDDGKIQIESCGEGKSLIQKLNGNSRLVDIADIRTGIMGFEYWKMAEIVSDMVPKKGYVRLYTNGNFRGYESNWGIAPVSLYKKKFLRPTMELNPSYLNANTIALFEHTPKLIVRGVSKRLVGIVDLTGSGLLVAVHSVIPKQASWQYILALINSNLLNWYHLNTQYSVRIPQGSLKYPISFFKSLPIPSVNKANRVLVGELEKRVDKIVTIKQSGSDKDTSLLQREIDELTYRLYGLTEDEVSFVEEKSTSSTDYSEELISELSDAEDDADS